MAEREAEHALRALRRELAGPLVDNVRRGETALSPGVLQEDIAFYLDPARFEREHRALFRALPILACLSVDLPGPGTFRTFDEAGAPMLLTRGKDGRVRAFLNICPHRASRVVREPSGKASRFTCRFHGWTFDANGACIGVPDEANFCGEIGDQKRLTECPAAERHGMIFVRSAPGPEIDLEAHFGSFDRDFAALGIEQAEIVHCDDLHVEANWKYGLDTFFETYHLNSLHRETFKGLFSPICVFDTSGPHHRYTFSPLGIADWPAVPESDWDVDLIPLQYFLFPNTIVSVGSTSPSGLTVNIHQIFPSAADRFVSRLSYCALGGIKSDEHRAEVDAAYLRARSALVDEDYSVAAESHRGLLALPAGSLLPVGRQEIGVQNFHSNINRAI
ncbi:MAG: aromatic ring-hydroxylating dioxygenase subunit alpha [Novosphingobium sp.]